MIVKLINILSWIVAIVWAWSISSAMASLLMDNNQFFYILIAIISLEVFLLIKFCVGIIYLLIAGVLFLTNKELYNQYSNYMNDAHPNSNINLFNI